MAITLVGTATGTNTATPPSHQAGDLFLVFAFRDGSATVPTLASGFTSVNSGGANTCSGIVGRKIATSSSDTVGTWTNATSVILIVLRGVDQTTPIGTANLSTGASTTITYPSVTPQRTDGTSWMLCFGGHRSADVAIDTLPSGMTLATSVSDATDEAAAFYLSGLTGAFTSRNAAVGGTSSGWRSHSIEVRAALATATAVLTDASDAVASAGVAPVSGQAVTADGADVIASSGAVTIVASLALVDGGDLVSALAATVTPVTASATLLDAADGIASGGRVAAAASVALSDGNDGIAVAGSAAILGSVAISDGSDGISVAGRVAIGAGAALGDGNDLVAAVGRIAVSAAALAADAVDAVSASGRVAVAAVTILDDGSDQVVSAGQAAISALAVFCDSDDAIAGAGSISSEIQRVRLIVRARAPLRAVARAPEQGAVQARPSLRQHIARETNPPALIARAGGPLRLVARDAV